MSKEKEKDSDNHQISNNSINININNDNDNDDNNNNNNKQHVAFPFVDERSDERRKKYLTAKYGLHQMALIKKRLRIEMWLYEQLQELSNSQRESDDSLVDIDLDALLDIDGDKERIKWLENKLQPFNRIQSSNKIGTFIEEIIEKAKLL